MINNYKAQRNVRAELGGAVDLGEPVSLYIKEDEVAVASKNLITNGKYNVDADPLWLTGTDANGVEGWSISGGKATKSAPAANSGIEQSNIFENGKTYQVNFTILDRTQGSIAVYRGQGTQLIYSSSSSSMNDSHSIIFTSTTNAHKILFNGTGNFDGSIDNVSVYEVLDHTYKLMAVNDTIPAQSVNAEAKGSELITNTNFESSDANWTLVYAGGSGSGATLDTANTSSPLAGTKDLKLVNNAGENAGVVSNGIAFENGKTYIVRMKYIVSGGNAFSKIGSTNSSTGGTNISGSSQQTLSSTSLDTMEHTFTAGESGTFYFTVFAGNGITFQIDDVSVKEVYGYDYYNAPAYKFGIVSSVYDQSTGAMKTSGVEGDEVDVTVQGECTLRKSGTYSLNKDRLITRITAASALETVTPSSVAGDYTLPNTVAVTSEITSSSNTQPIILWQGVEFSEHFVHKNSLQVIAKCDETITKFRPVSLFLDSNGDLLCRHDDIPEGQVLVNSDHTGVDAGKWGVAELGGVSGELIPVTVAGKTKFKTDNSVPYRNAGDLITRLSEGGWLATTTNIAGFTPNALGTVMESGGAGDEVSITIFQGTPIGTITDWKRTIKVTAKANGTINDFTAVSLYLDQYGNYKCISDGIPNLQINQSNGIWCDFRKWGIAQNNASDGEDVEIIVQGRTRVRNSSQGANKGDFVRKIDSNGYVSGSDVIGNALSTLGIVEKESRINDGVYGVIIIF